MAPCDVLDSAVQLLFWPRSALALGACAFDFQPSRLIEIVDSINFFTQVGHRETVDVGEVLALAQTTDGYLWLGTDTGLVRFDGIRFESFQSFSGQRLPV